MHHTFSTQYFSLELQKSRHELNLSSKGTTRGVWTSSSTAKTKACCKCIILDI